MKYILNYNYDVLKGAIKEKFQTNGAFAGALGISERSLSLKLNNEVPFKQPEIDKSIEILNINPRKIKRYFFTKIVQ